MFPAGVYVVSPDAAGLTVVDLFDVVAVETLTLPAGVNVPVEDKDDPVKLDETEPLG